MTSSHHAFSSGDYATMTHNVMKAIKLRLIIKSIKSGHHRYFNVPGVSCFKLVLLFAITLIDTRRRQ